MSIKKNLEKLINDLSVSLSSFIALDILYSFGLKDIDSLS